MAVVPLLVMRTAAVKPLFHSLLTTYWQFPVVAALLELLATELFELEVLTTELTTLELFELELRATLLELLLLLVDTLLELAPTMP